jgi:membrane associated rhomboid family serine protease
MRAITFVFVFGLLELYLGVSGHAPGIANFAHLGGMLFGFLMLRYWAAQRRR